ncbi:Nitroreductase NfnB [BD1-7 clade bacterium]|uniref:Nitroreductase NfnB n=1 Tax=BD1-7 clade bacterium TaxID=2029982 RepID=A0A5S9NU28_9GAMM|nr:Nitroreductase NfnB [BD1-7 clade bacterium]CAA0094126.1 Nitroreductase NfnB [BD1-7 clade bacterium]
MSELDVFSSIVRSRRSVRAFENREIPEDVLQGIFELAQTAPSNCNTQPWFAYVANGDACVRLRDALYTSVLSGEFDMDFPYLGKYEGVYKERQYDAAAQLYSAMGIAREEKDKRNAAFLRNFEFFGAPHVVFLFMQEGFEVREAVDVGMYAQNLMLSMQAHGVASCPQTALSFHAGKVREHLDVPENQKLLFGISFGYEDVNDPANDARVGRAPLAQTVKFVR